MTENDANTRRNHVSPGTPAKIITLIFAVIFGVVFGVGMDNDRRNHVDKPCVGNHIHMRVDADSEVNLVPYTDDIIDWVGPDGQTPIAVRFTPDIPSAIPCGNGNNHSECDVVIPAGGGSLAYNYICPINNSNNSSCTDPQLGPQSGIGQGPARGSTPPPPPPLFKVFFLDLEYLFGLDRSVKAESLKKVEASPQQPPLPTGVLHASVYCDASTNSAIHVSTSGAVDVPIQASQGTMIDWTTPNIKTGFSLKLNGGAQWGQVCSNTTPPDGSTTSKADCQLKSASRLLSYNVSGTCSTAAGVSVTSPPETIKIQ